MTMDVSQSEADFLTNSLFKDKVPVTYCTLSRSLGVHQNYAKKALYELYTKNKESLIATFVITGEAEQGKKIILVHGESELMDAQRNFSKVNAIHVYGLSNKVMQCNALDLAQEELKYSVKREELSKYYSRGGIKGPELESVDHHKPVSGPSFASNSKKESNVKVEDQSKANPVSNKTKNTGLMSGYVSRKQSNSARPTKRASTLGNYLTQKDNKSTVAKRPSTSGGYQYKSRKLSKNEPRERVIVSNEDAEDENADPSPSVKPKTTDLNSIFDDEFSDEGSPKNDNASEDNPESVIIGPAVDDDNVVAPETDVTEPVAKQEPPNDIFKSLTSQNVSESAAHDEGISSSKDFEDNLVEAKEPEISSKDPDEDGYFTSYRKKTPPQTQEKKAPVKKPPNKSSSTVGHPKKNDSKKAQSSLMSFFQKK